MYACMYVHVRMPLNEIVLYYCIMYVCWGATMHPIFLNDNNLTIEDYLSVNPKLIIKHYTFA